MTFVLDNEQRRFLRDAKRSFLFANRRDGTPTGWPMTPLDHDDGCIYFNTYRKSVKASVMRRDPRVSAVIEGDFDGKRRTLAVSGDAELMDQSEAASMFESMVRTDGFVPAEQVATTVARLQAGKRCLFRIHPRSGRWLV